MPAPSGWSDTPTVVDGVHKRFGRRPWVLAGVDLELAPGTLTQIVGGNGAGKSTLLRIVADLTLPTRGHVRARPASLSYAPERLPARLRMSARTYLGHMAGLRGVDVAPYLGLLDRLALSPGPDVDIRTLSKGNSQKVALAQALAPAAALVLLDEPSSGLDPAARLALAEVLVERRDAGAAVLLTTHVPFAGLPADATLNLANGTLAPLAPAPSRMRIELVAEGDGSRRVLEVDSQESDAVLASALAEGWSVVSVRAT